MELGRVVATASGGLTDLAHGGRMVRSGIRKHVRPDGIRATPDGVVGDRQGDTVAHGGPDKALCVFPSEHYPHYAGRLGRPLAPPAFGENLTTSGLLETDVCIGDLLAVGPVLVEVSVPRNPCYRLGALYGERQLPVWVEQCGRTGFYLRVREGGRIVPGCAVTLVRRTRPEATVAMANRVMHHDRGDVEGMRTLVGVPELTASWRRRFARRLEGEVDDQARRRYGDA